MCYSVAHGDLTMNANYFESQTAPGIIEVDLFSEDVDAPDHPEAVNFKDILEAVADEYQCCLLTFEVDKGTVSFSFDSDELTSEILKILQS